MAAIVAVGLVAATPAPAGLAHQAAPEAAPRTEPGPAPGRFLVASESIRDPRFRRAVILLVSHDDGGSLGVILNRPGDAPVAELLDGGKDERLHYGGPVQPRILSVLFQGAEATKDGSGADPGNDEGTDDDAEEDAQKDGFEIIRIPGGIGFALGHRSVEHILQGLEADRPRRVFSGYAGWSAGQLQGEIARGGWHVVTASADEVFADPADHWERLMRAFRGRWL